MCRLTVDCKVIPKVGLCMCMYDLLKASDGLIGNGTGNVNINGMLGHEKGHDYFQGGLNMTDLNSGIPNDSVSTVQRRDHYRDCTQVYTQGDLYYCTIL